MGGMWNLRDVEGVRIGHLVQEGGEDGGAYLHYKLYGVSNENVAGKCLIINKLIDMLYSVS
jgi:hypothetical protein